MTREPPIEEHRAVHDQDLSQPAEIRQQFRGTQTWKLCPHVKDAQALGDRLG